MRLTQRCVPNERALPARAWISLCRSVDSALAACKCSVLDSLLIKSGMSCTTSGSVSAVATRTTSLMASNAAVWSRVPSPGLSDYATGQNSASFTPRFFHHLDMLRVCSMLLLLLMLCEVHYMTPEVCGLRYIESTNGPKCVLKMG